MPQRVTLNANDRVALKNGRAAVGPCAGCCGCDARCCSSGEFFYFHGGPSGSLVPWNWGCEYELTFAISGVMNDYRVSNQERAGQPLYTCDRRFDASYTVDLAVRVSRDWAGSTCGQAAVTCAKFIHRRQDRQYASDSGGFPACNFDLPRSFTQTCSDVASLLGPDYLQIELAEAVQWLRWQSPSSQFWWTLMFDHRRTYSQYVHGLYAAAGPYNCTGGGNPPPYPAFWPRPSLTVRNETDGLSGSVSVAPVNFNRSYDCPLGGGNRDYGTFGFSTSLSAAWSVNVIRACPGSGARGGDRGTRAKGTPRSAGEMF